MISLLASANNKKMKKFPLLVDNTLKASIIVIVGGDLIAIDFEGLES